jgi:hypothetical protein
MPQLSNIDLVSFLLGFAVATAFWWLFRAFKIFLPRLLVALKHQAEVRRQRKLEGISRYVRQETLRRAQVNHLAHALFSLDEILVTPKLMAPPDYLLDPPIHTEGQRTAERLIPYLPDWPEFSAPFPVHTLTAAQAMSAGSNLAIIGEAGSGRSVALAHLASLVARRDPTAENLAQMVPIFIHAMDMDLQIDRDSDVLSDMRKIISKMVPIIAAAQLPKYTRELFLNGDALLLIDGLDELAPAALETTAAYLKSLISEYPKTRIALAASDDYLDGLLDIGVFPLSVAAWGTVDKHIFIDKWSFIWNASIKSEIEKRNGNTSDSLLLTTWLTADPLLQTPLEWTLKVWAAFAGDTQGPTSVDAVQAYILRLNHKNIPLEALSELAYNIFCSGITALPYELVETSFSKYKPDQNITDVASAADLDTGNESNNKPGKTKKQVRISSGANALNALIDSGILIESPDGKIRFAHLQVAGYLASRAFTQGQDLPEIQKPLSALQMQTIRYLAVNGKINSWVKKTIEQSDIHLNRSLLLAGRWLSDAAPELPWRSPVMRMLIQMIHNPQTPHHLQARCLAAILVSNDSSVTLLLKQLLESESDMIRQLAAVACGASQQTKTTMELIKLLNDPSTDVAQAACLSLGSFGTRLAFESMVDMLNNGEEDLQIAAAETLSQMPGGPEILREAAFSDRLLVRSAAIAGLTLVREDWTEELLERIALEDAQWIIRNAASEALEVLRTPSIHIPRPLPPPDRAGWLIEFAGKQGKGIIPGDPGTEYILSAAQNGSTAERLMAMQYLLSDKSGTSLPVLLNALNDPSSIVQEAAYHALRQMTSAGVEMPGQFGF